MHDLKNPPENWKDGLKYVKRVGSFIVILFFLFGILFYFREEMYSAILCLITGIIILISMVYYIFVNKEVWYRSYDYDYNLYNHIVAEFERYISKKGFDSSMKKVSSFLKQTQKSRVYEIYFPNGSKILVKTIYQQSYKVGGATGLKIANIEILKINRDNVFFVEDLVKLFNEVTSKLPNI